LISCSSVTALSARSLFWKAFSAEAEKALRSKKAAATPERIENGLDENVTVKKDIDQNSRGQRASPSGERRSARQITNHDHVEVVTEMTTAEV
jgi:hypothetical protein